LQAFWLHCTYTQSTPFLLINTPLQIKKLKPLKMPASHPRNRPSKYRMILILKTNQHSTIFIPLLLFSTSPQGFRFLHLYPSLDVRTSASSTCFQLKVVDKNHPLLSLNRKSTHSSTLSTDLSSPPSR
jgi:hypothetical protein